MILCFMPNFIHDHLFKFYMQDITLAQEFINKDELEYINLDTLKPEPVEMIGRNLKKSMVDILYSTKSRDNKTVIYILIEHQSTVDPLMNTRLTEYSMSIIRKHYRQYKEIPAVITMVVYAGRALFSLNKFHNIMRSNHRVLDLTKTSYREILNNKTISLVLLALKLRAKGRSKEFISVLNKHNCVKKLDKIDLNPLILYLADDPLTQNRQELLESFSNQMEADVMESYIRRLVNETEQMGIRKGLVEGKQQGLREVVNKLLAHMNKKQISQLLSISMAEVDKLCD